MRWLKLTVAYDGTNYAGWQIQPDSPTVQEVIETAWREITQETISITAAGRTDAGVHALGQVIGVATESPLSKNNLHQGLNALLPNDVAVMHVDDGPEGFHATHDAVSKQYRYQIHNSRIPAVFDRHFCWHFPRALDAQAMHKAGQVLVGQHDFSSFESAGSKRPTSVRTISELSVRRGEGNLSDRIFFEVTGDGFLYNMVRAIVGTLVKVGQGKGDTAWLSDVLAACDRRQAGQTAPPEGLFLVRVEY